MNVFGILDCMPDTAHLGLYVSVSWALLWLLLGLVPTTKNSGMSV